MTGKQTSIGFRNWLSPYSKKLISVATTTVLGLSALVGFSIGASAAPSDIVKPVIQSAATSPGGDVIILTYDETLFDPSPALFAGGQFVVSSVTQRNITGVQISGSTVRVTLDTPDVIACGEDFVTVSYTNTLIPVQDLVGNDADDLVDQLVVNNVSNCQGGGGGGGGGDTTPPTVSITSDREGQTATGDVTFTFTFDEDVTGFDEMEITGGTAGLWTPVSGTIYTLVVTPGADTDTSIRVYVAADVAYDLAGNGNVASAEFVQLVDTTTGGGGGGGGGGGDPDIVFPTVSITSDRAGQIATGDVTFTFTFSENVTGFQIGDVDITGGTKGTFTAVSGTIYTLVVEPDSDSFTNITVNVAADAAGDLAGNGNVAATEFVQLVDTINPTVSITSDREVQTATGDVTFRFTFDDDVTGFDASDIEITGGTKGAFNEIDGDPCCEYTLVVTPDADTTTSIRVNVAADVANDLAGNGNELAAEFVQQVDTILPTVSITSNRQGETAGGDVVFTITFDRPITGFHGTEVVVTGGTRLSLTGTNPGTVYLATVRPDADTTTSIRVNIAAGVVQDSDGKGNSAATEFEQLVDTLDPTVSITSDLSGAASSYVTLTFTFDEDVTGFDASDIVITGGTAASPVTETSARVYTLLVLPGANTTTSIRVNVAAGVADDLVGNSNAAATEFEQLVDTINPTVEISTFQIGPTYGEDVTFIFVFDENVTGFDESDIEVTGGTKGTFVGGGTTYTLVVSPNYNTTTSIRVSVPSGAAQDSAGNGSVPTDEFEQLVDTIDTVDPTVSITSNRAGQTATGDVTFTFTFNENVTGFTASDIDITGGTKGAFTKTGDRTYTLVVSPGANTDTSIRVNVSADVASDLAENGNVGATEFEQLVDTIDEIDPTVSITSNRAGQTATGDVTFTFTFDEDITGFDISDIVITGGTKGAFTVLSSTGTGDRTFTLVVSPGPNTTTSIRVNVAADVAADLAENGNVAAVEFVQLVDTTTPGGGGSGGGDTITQPPTQSAQKAMITGFAPDSSKLTKKMKKEIRELLEANPTLNNFVCKGYTSSPATAQDKALAKQRGKATCNFIKSIRPDAQVTVRSGSHTNKPGSQIRRVSISLS